MRSIIHLAVRLLAVLLEVLVLAYRQPYCNFFLCTSVCVTIFFLFVFVRCLRSELWLPRLLAVLLAVSRLLAVWLLAVVFSAVFACVTASDVQQVVRCLRSELWALKAQRKNVHDALGDHKLLELLEELVHKLLELLELLEDVNVASSSRRWVSPT